MESVIVGPTRVVRQVVLSAAATASISSWPTAWASDTPRPFNPTAATGPERGAVAAATAHFGDRLRHARATPGSSPLMIDSEQHHR